LLPGAANDIGIGPSNYAWVIGNVAAPGGFGIHVWDEQAQFFSAPTRAEWVFQGGGGGATNISVGPTGAPWITNNVFNIFRPLK
jgi:hypothetical protein